MSDPKTTKQSFLSTGKGKLVAVAVGSVMVIGATFGVQAVASSKPFQHLKLAASDTSAYTGGFQNAGWSRGWGHGGGHGGRHGFGARFAEMSDADVAKFVTRMVKHAGIEIDATAEQQEKIAALATALVKQMRPMREQMRDAGKQVHVLLLKDAVDRDALERLRSERFAEIERMSKDVTKALADVAEILTPEQRKKVDERIQEFRSMRGHHRGPRDNRG